MKIRAGQSGGGTGVVCRDDGMIVTNAHVAVWPSMEVEMADGMVVKGEVTARDPAQDLAVIRVDSADLPVVDFADSDELRPGSGRLPWGIPWA